MAVVVVLALIIVVAGSAVAYLLIEARREENQPHLRYQAATASSRGLEAGSLANTAQSSKIRSTVDRFLSRHKKKNSGPIETPTSPRRSGQGWVQASGSDHESDAEPRTLALDRRGHVDRRASRLAPDRNRGPRDVEADLVQRILDNARLPSEVLALAFNILEGLKQRQLPQGYFYGAPSDLLVASALRLAVVYTDDKPPSFRYWSREVCSGMWTAARIDKTVLQILDALYWRIHDFTSAAALQKTMQYVPLS